MAGKFELKKSKNEKFFFNLHASNGQIILSSEMYEAKGSAQGGIESVKKNGGNAANYEKLTGKDGSPYFTLKAANHQVIGQSQMYSSESARDGGIASCVQNAPDATVDDQTV
ncbi:YegP family protein [Ottowia thiooxydans]|uniref:YegP family protein n=1 Tax=Ottowia thiooxydans TaxID=219182 RepID=UPI0003F5C3EB|nr:YegP family protein [Ottowia thiooxydans]